MCRFLHFSDLSFRYLAEDSANTLDHTELSIEQGKTTVLVGGSGCGKSTLALLAAGIYPANGGQLISGEVTLLGKKVENFTVSDRARLLTVLFQNPDLQFCMDTLRKELIFCLENISVSPTEMDSRILDFAQKFQVEELLDRKLHTLSGGEKQKAALCCLLLLNSQGIILDEPFANLDPASGAELMQLLKRLPEENGTTLIAIDHKLDHWIDFADEIIVLGEGGRVLQRGIAAANIGEYRELFEKEGLFYPEEKMTFRPVEYTGEPQLTLHNLTLGYQGRPLLEGATADFYKGSMTALLGPSGVGKTSLFTAILGQIRYDGSILLEGQEIAKIKPKRLYKSVGAVFQNPANQFVALNVLEEAEYGLQCSKDVLEEQALGLLDQYGLKKYRNFSPYMLSQGQQRRLAVLSMLAGSQKLLLLDEPTYGQDKRNTDMIMSQLRELCADGMTVLFSTHDRETAIRYSDYIYELREGKVLPWNG